MTLPPTQLLLYGFGPDARFEGQLVGALERIESGGTLRIRDAFLVRRDAETGELEAIALRGGSAGIVAPLLDFRLDPSERRQASERALGAGTAGLSGDTLRQLGNALQPGAAVAGVLIEHIWAGAMEDAVSRTGGTPLVNEFVEAASLEDLAPHLLAVAVRRAGWADV